MLNSIVIQKDWLVSMRVLLIFSTSELGGAERSLSRMTFISHEVDYQLVTLCGEGPWCDWVRSEGHEPLVLGRKSSDSGLMIRAIWRLLLHIRSKPVDLIYICGFRASLLLRLLRIFIPRTRLVHGVRWNPDSNSRLDRLLRFMEKFTYRLIDAWITNSEVAKRTLVSRCGIPIERVFVIYNGLETFPKDVSQFNDRSMEVLTVANLNPRKGHRQYLEVVRKVLIAVPDAKFVFLGRDDMNGEVERAITEAGLSGFVQYEGFHADVTPWYRRARVMVLPSLWGEGCPTSILEGFAFGLPVVAYAIDGIPELIKDGVDGFVVSMERQDELVNAIVKILKNQVRAKKMGMLGREKVFSNFTLARCTEQHEQTFKKVISIE